MKISLTTIRIALLTGSLRVSIASAEEKIVIARHGTSGYLPAKAMVCAQGADFLEQGSGDNRG